MSKNTTQVSLVIIVVCSAPTGYWRGGHQFVKGNNEIVVDEFTEEQLARINADPRLQVLQGEDEATKTGGNSNPQGPLDESGLERLAKLKLIIPKLEQGNKAHFTKDGKPQLEELAKHDLKVRGKERDELWAHFTATQDDNGEQD